MAETYIPPATKLCPRDATMLASNDVDGYRYYSCPKCHGCWIPGSALRRAMRLEAAQDILGKLTSAAIPSLPCPNGDATLTEVVVQGREIDVCPSCHSVWLDDREAVAIADCFQEDSAIVEADRAKPQEPVSTTTIILEGIGTIVTLIFR